jgi:hypothetical protein
MKKMRREMRMSDPPEVVPREISAEDLAGVNRSYKLAGAIASYCNEVQAHGVDALDIMGALILVYVQAVDLLAVKKDDALEHIRFEIDSWKKNKGHQIDHSVWFGKKEKN